MFQVYNGINGKRLYVGSSYNFAMAHIEKLILRGIPHILVIE